MPTYEYHCDVCEHHFDEFRSMTEPHPSKCPKCGESYADGQGKFHQAYENYRPVGLVYGEPTTFGQAAERNAKRVGKDRLAVMKEMAKPENRKKDTLKLPKGAKKVARPSGDVETLDVSKVSNVERFVNTGQQ